MPCASQLQHDWLLFTELMCAQMLTANAATRICSRLLDNDQSGLMLFRSTEVLWSLLENGVETELAAQLSTVECVR